MMASTAPLTTTLAPERRRPAHLARRRRTPTAPRILAGLGRSLIAAGLLVLLFVAYQLWGTGLQHDRAQAALEDRFEAQLYEFGDTRARGADPATAGAPPQESPPAAAAPPMPPSPTSGDPVGRLVIPEIGLDEMIVEGVSVEDLKQGPGHFPGTPLPGQDGNAAVAGHRTTYGAPFYRIDELEAGDEILVTTLQGEFRYTVTEQLIVTPDRVDVLDDQGDDRLTLASCHPRYSARQRIVVVAQLTGTPQPAPAPPPASNTTPEPATLGFEEGTNLSGAPATRWPAVLWAAVVVGTAVAVWAAGRLWRRLPVHLAGLPVLLAALFMFFEQISRLLPANF